MSSVMRRHWIGTPPSASVADVILLMRLARVRQLPVVAAGILVGLVDNRRMLAATLASLRDSSVRTTPDAIRVGSVMEPDPPTVRPDEGLGVAALRMHDAGIGCLPVVDDESRLVGLVVESDLLRSFYVGEDRSRP